MDRALLCLRKNLIPKSLQPHGSHQGDASERLIRRLLRANRRLENWKGAKTYDC
jgi:hypothetical protein